MICVCEVKYNIEEQEFRRSRECDRVSGGGVNADWDFYGRVDNGWVTDATSNFQTVVSGVDSLVAYCLDSSGFMDEESTVNRLPLAVQVEITLYDTKLKDAPAEVRDRTKRTFTKTVFLGNRD